FHEIVCNEDTRFFHILETQMVEHMVKPRFRARPMFIGDEDLAFAQIGLADLPTRSKPAEVLTGKCECQDFLQKIVEKLWQQIEKDLKPFSHRSIAAACFRAIDEINRDSEHWKMTTRSVLALQQEVKQTK